jgi:hypothetical protein
MALQLLALTVLELLALIAPGLRALPALYSRRVVAVEAGSLCAEGAGARRQLDLIYRDY